MPSSHKELCAYCGEPAELKRLREDTKEHLLYYECSHCKARYRPALTPTGALIEMNAEAPKKRRRKACNVRRSKTR